MVKLLTIDETFVVAGTDLATDGVTDVTDGVTDGAMDGVTDVIDGGTDFLHPLHPLSNIRYIRYQIRCQ